MAARYGSAVLGHLGVNVPDLAAARAYYGTLMPRLGFEVFLDDDDQLAFMPTGGKRGTFLFLYPSLEDAAYSRHRTGLQHLAFMVPTRDAVREVWALAGELGREPVLQPAE